MQSRMEKVKEMFLVECVPNICAGKDPTQIKELVEKQKAFGNATMLNADIGESANRSVLTYVGTVTEIFETVTELYRNCSEFVNMQKYSSIHPYIGAVDVCPFICFDAKFEKVLVDKVSNFAQNVSGLFQIPVFLYAKSSKNPTYKKLPDIRKGGYQRLMNARNEMEYSPDFGTEYFNTAFGGTTIGVREFMIAYNINLRTNNLGEAQTIAKKMRTIREKIGTFNNKNIKPLQILAWRIEEYNCCQISTNIHNPREISIVDVYNFCREVAAQHNIDVESSELIGMIPSFAWEIAKSRIRAKNRYELIEYLGLSFSDPFDPEKRIIEKVLEDRRVNENPKSTNAH